MDEITLEEGESKKDTLGYITIRKNGYIVLEHRAIWEEHYGKIPEGMFIHHINGNREDNRIENLQLCDRKTHGLLHHKPNRIRIVHPGGNISVKKIK